MTTLTNKKAPMDIDMSRSAIITSVPIKYVLFPPWSFFAPFASFLPSSPLPVLFSQFMICVFVNDPTSESASLASTPITHFTISGKSQSCAAILISFIHLYTVSLHGAYQHGLGDF